MRGRVADDSGHVVPVARQGVDRDGIPGPVEQARARARDNLDELSRAREDFDATEAG